MHLLHVLGEVVFDSSSELRKGFYGENRNGIHCLEDAHFLNGGSEGNVYWNELCSLFSSTKRHKFNHIKKLCLWVSAALHLVSVWQDLGG